MTFLLFCRLSMLAFRRVATVHQYLYPLSSYSIRYKSKKANSDEKKEQPTSLSEELLNFDRKDANTSRDSAKMKTRLETKPSKPRKWIHLTIVDQSVLFVFLFKVKPSTILRHVGKSL